MALGPMAEADFVLQAGLHPQLIIGQVPSIHRLSLDGSIQYFTIAQVSHTQPLGTWTLRDKIFDSSLNP